MWWCQFTQKYTSFFSLLLSFIFDFVSLLFWDARSHVNHTDGKTRNVWFNKNRFWVFYKKNSSIAIYLIHLYWALDVCIVYTLAFGHKFWYFCCVSIHLSFSTSSRDDALHFGCICYIRTRNNNNNNKKNSCDRNFCVLLKFDFFSDKFYFNVKNALKVLSTQWQQRWHRWRR